MNLLLFSVINCYQRTYADHLSGPERNPMFHLKITKPKKGAAILFLAIVFVLGLALGIWRGASSPANRKFETYTNGLFEDQVSQNTLNLHYTLADPKEYGINDYTVTLGAAAIENAGEYYTSIENNRNILSGFSYDSLSKENQLTFDILDLYFETELSLGDNYILSEMLSPSLGIQAQLPLLLAEYNFQTRQDVTDYLKLLMDIPSYFEDILRFEEKKSQNGCFMSDTTADRIIAQCSSFISSGDSNYLNTVFQQKIEENSFLSDKEKNACLTKHSEIVQKYVLPSYEKLIAGLTQLKGSGTNDNGLFYLDGGKDYYEYLLKSNCGIYRSVEELQTRLGRQLLADYREIQSLLESNPSLTTSVFKSVMTDMTPQQMLTDLQKEITRDFPDPPSVSYDIKYIHEDLKEYLSPAFYLTPPIDTHTPNMIYLNPASSLTGVELYTTLAHEGFPGHLYQTHYFAQSSHAPIRHLLNLGGYIEGWATYTESYAYNYAGLESGLGRLLWLDRSMNLCLYSLLDIGIHYYGWTLTDTTEYLQGFGISDTSVIREIFQCIVEDPSNYIRYYGGCLSFMDLREEVFALDEDIQPVDFHREVLEIGPCQFPILEEHVLEAF